ncbi:MAG: family 20 glycosylhydrolase [Opitutae bacterium]|nr:family 20 glycosylhydrolase [Opitutae bacterium]
MRVTTSAGEFVFNRSTVILADGLSEGAVKMLVNHLPKFWQPEGKILGRGAAYPGGVPRIVFTSDGSENLPAEGYRLTVTPETITIRGKSAGLFYGLQSLIQLFPATEGDSVRLPCLEIEDYPRFGYRGLMLDVARHFFTVQQVKDCLDLMASYKLNRFHWHLTDDHGWRIEIKSFPKLTEIGAWRVPRVGTFGANEPPRPGEAATDGGFYSQADIADIVRYAKERNIEILPEIDVPGHCMAALAAYPELCCTKDPAIKVNPGSKFATWYDDGKYVMHVDNTLNPADEAVYRFLDTVFGEVSALFPYEYIHVGGDECFKGYWEKDAGVREFMQRHGLKNAAEVQSHFIKRVSQLLAARHKKLIGWDEIVEGGLAPDATVMARFTKNNREVPAMRHGVIMTPGSSGLYFDYAQSDSPQEPSNHGGYSPLELTYGYDPVPAEMSREAQKYILGVEGCLWTEHVHTVAKMQYMIWPRGLALAEIAWSPPHQKDYARFIAERLPRHLAKFDAAGINYRVPPAQRKITEILIGKDFTLDLRPPVPGAKIYYTYNGRTPSDADQELTKPLHVIVPENKKAELQTLVVTPTGRRSVVTRTLLYNRAPMRPTEYTANTPGLKFRLMKGAFTTTEQLEYARVLETGVVPHPSAMPSVAKLPASGVILEGLIRIDADGNYAFSASSRDGSRLYLNDELVVDNDVPFFRYEKEGVVPLQKGFHRIKIKYFLRSGASVPKLQMTAPDGQKKDLPHDCLFY